MHERRCPRRPLLPEPPVHRQKTVPARDAIADRQPGVMLERLAGIRASAPSARPRSERPRMHLQQSFRMHGTSRGTRACGSSCAHWPDKRPTVKYKGIAPPEIGSPGPRRSARNGRAVGGWEEQIGGMMAFFAFGSLVRCLGAGHLLRAVLASSCVAEAETSHQGGTPRVGVLCIDPRLRGVGELMLETQPPSNSGEDLPVGTGLTWGAAEGRKKV